MTIRQMKYAWKYRRFLWKYRKLLRHRKAIGGAAAAAGIAGLTAWYFLRGTSSPSMASNG